MEWHCAKYIICIFFATSFQNCLSFNWNSINLPPEHLSVYFSNNPLVADTCRTQDSCPFKNYLEKNSCWGYEELCNQSSFSTHHCPDSHRGWVKTKEEQLELFYKQADFGFVKVQREEMKIYCHPESQEDSYLECSDHLRFCRGKNIAIDFRDLAKRQEMIRYHMDVLKQNEIKGKCRLNAQLLKSSSDHLSPLQSWAPELRYFAGVSQKLNCDIWVNVSTIIMKIDAAINMYHHFCDFFNLYASLHVNASDPDAFSQQRQIIIWESFPYMSNFQSAWEAFTNLGLWNLDNVKGKRICFSDVMFSLLPRMIFGLYYNTPLIWGCEKSSLFHAFYLHFLHRLKIPQREEGDGKIHVTFLARSSEYRKVLNEHSLIKALKQKKNYIVQKVEYSHQMDFKLQLKQDQWTDIFIGMHGSGLTHLLFLPDWAVVFELYNCGDVNCYKDLARLRGIKYITWEDASKVIPEDEGHHPELGAHEKFTNYKFGTREFLRLVSQAETYVKEQRGWQNLNINLSNVLHEEL